LKVSEGKLKKDNRNMILSSSKSKCLYQSILGCGVMFRKWKRNWNSIKMMKSIRSCWIIGD